MVVTWTYNAGTNTATASGAGSTNFAALVAADTAGGWGKYTSDATGTQGQIAGKIILGDGTNAATWTDIDKQFIIKDAWAANGDKIILVKPASTLTLGALVDDTTRRTKQGCSFTNLESTTSDYLFMIRNEGGLVYLYGCIFNAIKDQAFAYSTITLHTGDKVYNCITQNVVFKAYSDTVSSVTLDNVLVQRCSDSAYIGLIGTFNGISASDVTGTKALFQTSGGTWLTSNITISNGVCKNSYPLRFYNSNGYDVYLVNLTTSSWTMLWGSNYGDSRAYRQYTFDLETAPSATVILKNAAGTTIFSVVSDASGVITQQTVSRGYYANATGDTLQDYGPFTLTVSKAGYLTYVHSGIVLDEKVDWRIQLTPAAAIDLNRPDLASQTRPAKTKIVRVENPADEALLMGVAYYLVKSRRQKREILQLKEELRRQT